MPTTLAEVLRHFEPEFLRSHTLSTAQARAWRAIVSCRTPALGGELMQCGSCGVQQWHWHSCRNRHCPQCQSRQRDAWRAARLAELLNVPYCHLVFTLPHELNPLAAMHPHWVYDTLMQCTAATLSEFAANPRWLGGTGAFTLVLHTWTQDLRRHVHVHALMACGALRRDDDGGAVGAAGGDGDGGGRAQSSDGDAGGRQDQRDGAGAGRAEQCIWVKPTRNERFLFPVHALSKVFRGKFLDALDAAKLAEDPADTPQRKTERATALRRHDWVVYAKTALAGPAAVLDYLSRYTHRTAIGNERLVAIRGDQVSFRVRADDSGGKRCIALPGAQFIERLLLHVLPSGFKRIRHFGLLAPALKTKRLALARRLLEMPAASPQAREDAQAFMHRVAAIDIGCCPHCKTGRWVVIACALPQRSAVTEVTDVVVSGPLPAVACRGPP